MVVADATSPRSLLAPALRDADVGPRACGDAQDRVGGRRRAAENSRLGFGLRRRSPHRLARHASPRTQQANPPAALTKARKVTLGARDYDPRVGRWMSRDPLLL